MNWYIRIRGYWTITGLHLDIRTVKPCFHFLQAGTHSLTHTHSVLQILRWSQYSNFKLLQVFLQHGSNDYFLSCRCCHSGTCPSHFSTFAVFGVRHRTCNVCIFNDHLWLLWLCHIFPWHRFNELFPENDPVALWVVLYIKLVIDTNDFTLTRRPTFVETEYSHQLPANLLPPNYHHRTQHPTTSSTSHQQKGELHTSDCGDDKSTQKFQPHSINSEVFWRLLCTPNDSNSLVYSYNYLTYYNVFFMNCLVYATISTAFL